MRSCACVYERSSSSTSSSIPAMTTWWQTLRAWHDVLRIAASRGTGAGEARAHQLGLLQRRRSTSARTRLRPSNTKRPEAKTGEAGLASGRTHECREGRQGPAARGPRRAPTDQTFPWTRATTLACVRGVHNPAAKAQLSPRLRELRVERDLGNARKCLRDGTVLLRLFRRLFKRTDIQPGNAPLDRERDLRDPLAGLERHGRGRVEPLGHMTALREAMRESHREARRMRGGDQLLRARLAPGVFRACGPADVESADRAARHVLDAAAPAHQVSAPDHLRTPFSRHSLLLRVPQCP